MNVWCFNDPMLDDAHEAFHARKQAENGGGAINYKREILEFLLSPEAEKLRVEFRHPTGVTDATPTA